MRLVRSTTKTLKGLLFSAAILLGYLTTHAQENSPYSRYGLGDIVPAQNTANKAMGGIGAAVADYQGVNLQNPASFAANVLTSFDVGFSIDSRKLKSITSAQKANFVNTNINYLALAFPLTSEKMMKKGNAWGLGFGLKPVSRINYNITSEKRLIGVDTMSTAYEGSGGLQEVTLGTGLRIKNFSIGAAAGYAFGNKSYSTKVRLYNNDSLYYDASNTESKASFGSFFVNSGIQYEIKLKQDSASKAAGNLPSVLRFGANVIMPYTLKGNSELLQEKYIVSNEIYQNIDTIAYSKGADVTIKMPLQYAVGFSYQSPNWLVGMDYSFAGWGAYKYNSQPSYSQDIFTIRGGMQYYPGVTSANQTYMRTVRYRAGFYYGKDYIKVNNVSRSAYGFTAGAGFPLTSARSRSLDFAILNAGLDVGSRGGNSSILKEGIVRFSVGLAVNGRWFIKRKYD